MSSINGIASDIMKGLPRYNTMRIERWQIPGVDGFGAMSMGFGNGQSTLQFIKFGSNAVVEAWATLMETLPGSQPVSIVDDYGDNHVGFLVVGVTNRIKSAAGHSNGALTDQRCEIGVTVIQV